MRTIHKYKFGLHDNEAVLQLPAGSKILHVALDGSNQPCVWARVNTNQKLVDCTLLIFGTGHQLPDDLKDEQHLGTFQISIEIWHVFLKES